MEELNKIVTARGLKDGGLGKKYRIEEKKNQCRKNCIYEDVYISKTFIISNNIYSNVLMIPGSGFWSHKNILKVVNKMT